MEKLIIIGAGQQGRICKRLAIENGIEVIGFVDDYVENEVEGIKVYKNIEDIENYKDYKYHIAFGKIEIRKKFVDKIQELGLETINLIDKTALIEEGAKIGKGNYIYKNAIIYASSKIGDNNIINCKAVCATDSVIGNNNNISMGCNICGGVNIGDNCYIGCQASVVSGIKIGNNVTIGGSSFVMEDIDDNKFYVGVPAKEKK